MTRKLHPHTIVPETLYVERAADRQLHEIIDGMGRPGYVLVARQMGKTNLLLNARRKLESKDLLFVYVDLSTRIQSIESYFGLLLSTAFAVHPVLFEASGLPENSRNTFSPFEFETVLRKILANYPGRIVFILDEVDSLANYPNSDRIFSQIRSMYFSRSNFPEYHRVTYVLSGVAEPSDLIKDKNISPFNIGEKVYLNDFTHGEFLIFLERAGLELAHEIQERVFYWSRGNPRITWDICSEVETEVLKGRELKLENIDQIVSRLYLTSFDQAPVDHIRTLAQSDREIRQALILLRQHKEAEISDRVRNKLYLAGIASMFVSQGEQINFSIKNPIVSEALSERWLKGLEREATEVLLQARNSVEEKRWGPAASYYEQYLNEHEIEKGSLDNYRLAIAYFNTRRHAKAVERLNDYLSSATDPEEASGATNLLLGRAHIVLGNMDEAIRVLRLAAGSRSKLTSGLGRALLASAILQTDRTNTEINELSTRALADVTDNSASEAANIRIIALTNLASLEENKGNNEEAIELLEQASSENSPTYGPHLLLRQIKLLSDETRKQELIEKLTDAVIGIGSIPAEQRMDGALRQIALPAMMYLKLNRKNEDFDRLLAYVMESGEYESIELPKLFDALHTLSNEYGEPGGEVFLTEIVERFGEQQNAASDVLQAVRLLVLAERFEFTDRYLSILGRRDNQTLLNAQDLIGIGFILSREKQHTLLDKKKFEDAIARVRSSVDEKSINYVFFSYYDMHRLRELGRGDEALVLAKELVQLLDEGTEPLASWSLSSRKIIEDSARSLIRRNTPQLTIRNTLKHIGRNTVVTVRYNDGRILERKYKTVQKDIALELCSIVPTPETFAEDGQ